MDAHNETLKMETLKMETLKTENARLKQMLGIYMKEDFDKIRRINQEKDLQQRRELCCLFKVNM